MDTQSLWNEWGSAKYWSQARRGWFHACPASLLSSGQDREDKSRETLEQGCLSSENGQWVKVSGNPQMCSKASLFKVWFSISRNLCPTPELQNPHLHFMEIPRWSICTFERHCCRYYWGSLHRVHSSSVSYQNQVEGICSILDCICSIQFVKLISHLLNGVMQFSTKGDTSVNLPISV